MIKLVWWKWSVPKMTNAREKDHHVFFVKIANSLAANCSLAVSWLEALKNKIVAWLELTLYVHI